MHRSVLTAFLLLSVGNFAHSQVHVGTFTYNAFSFAVAAAREGDHVDVNGPPSVQHSWGHVSSDAFALAGNSFAGMNTYGLVPLPDQERQEKVTARAFNHTEAIVHVGNGYLNEKKAVAEGECSAEMKIWSTKLHPKVKTRFVFTVKATSDVPRSAGNGEMIGEVLVDDKSVASVFAFSSDDSFLGSMWVVVLEQEGKPDKVDIFPGSNLLDGNGKAITYTVLVDIPQGKFFVINAKAIGDMKLDASRTHLGEHRDQEVTVTTTGGPALPAPVNAEKPAGPGVVD